MMQKSLDRGPTVNCVFFYAIIRCRAVPIQRRQKPLVRKLTYRSYGFENSAADSNK
jgi:hypothetical protein